MPLPPKPYLPASPPGQTPEPCTVTPALLKTHSITPDEYESLHGKLRRTPSLTELGIFSVMWSEHCSYKSSRVHLKRLPTVGERTSGPGSVVQGPGENAGIIDVGDGWACAFKIESHNHPSYIEPYQGAATGVGGILRDIFTMNARPMAIMDSLRFGPLSPPDKMTRTGAPPSAVSSPKVGGSATETDYARNRHTMTGVVHGVAGYGNCFGVPNLGGETRFEPCYSGNPLVNAFALGLVRKDEIFYAKATGVGNPVIYVGAKTGRDGIHGATMASEEFTEGSEQKRPNVQMGDPFLEKLLLEACLEAMATGAVLGIQDMGAAGLTCSTCEMGARGELGVSIELDLVPQRETGMSSYEIMLSESQERMLLVAQAGREHEVLAVFLKWGLDAAIVGVVTADDVMRVFHHGTLVAEIPNKALTDEAPVYHRPVGTWTPPVPKDPPAWVLEELKKPRDYTADLKKLLASPNICSKQWIYEQYDSMVQTNTVQGPGGEAGLIRIKGTGNPAATPSSTFHEDSSSRPERSGVEGPPHFAGSGAEAGEPPLASKRSAASPQPSAESATPGFLGPPALAASAEHLDPLAVEHSILGKLASFIAQSTPEAEAVHLTGNEDAANPVVAPDATHTSGQPGSAAVAPEAVPGAKPTMPAPERGLAMALAGNGRWCYLNPKLGAMHAVAEAARKVACTGATPVAATNCLNFGNPEKPEIMAQLSQAIDGIAEACRALGTPITGGNVSLYNETKGEGIYPTPVIGIVGILDDVIKAVPSAFQQVGDAICLVFPTPTNFDSSIPNWSPAEWRQDTEERRRRWLCELGSSEYAKVLFGELWGTVPSIDLQAGAIVNKVLVELAKQRLLHSAADEGSGSIAVTVTRCGLPNNIGADFTCIDEQPGPLDYVSLFSESSDNIVITCALEDARQVEVIARKLGAGCQQIGRTIPDFIKQTDLGYSEPPLVWSLDELRRSFSESLDSHIAAEVVTA